MAVREERPGLGPARVEVRPFPEVERVFGTDAMARKFDDRDSYRVNSTTPQPDHLKRPY